MEDIKGKLTALAESVAGQYGVEVVDIEMTGNLRRPTLKIFIEKSGGVTLDDCERVSRAMSALLDVEDPIKSPYVLEVSSPGLDRPLKRLKDFESSIGKLARIITRDSIDKQNFFVGRITDVRGSDITLTLKNDSKMTIQLEQIAKARLEIELP